MCAIWKLMGESASADETRAIGADFARRLRSGDIVLLSGDLGAGKTQFVQGIAAGLGVREMPVSPTFNIVLTYGSGRMPLHHFDLYRLDTREQLEDIGLPEYLESGGVCCIEWAEKFSGTFEALDGCYEVEIEKGLGDVRRIRLREPEGAAESEGETVAATPIAAARGESGPSKTLMNAATAGNVSVGSLNPEAGAQRSYVLAFDTSNEVVAIGVGALERGTAGRVPAVPLIATREIPAHRASNTTLVPAIDEMLLSIGVSRDEIACVCVGRGPGSFTGVRIAMATAKGIASALGVGLVGVSTLDAIAWNAWATNVRGDALVLADAMRKEVYPVRYLLDEAGVRRMSADCVVKADEQRARLEALAAQDSDAGSENPAHPGTSAASIQLLGDALIKYRDSFEPHGTVLPRELWEVTGRGLLLALEAAWRAGEVDPLDAVRHNPAFALPVYTRLSDAEENERIRLARNDEKNLVTGVQDLASGDVERTTMHSQARLVAPSDAQGVSYHPLDAAHVEDVAALEAVAMGSDAWSARLVADELGQRNRTWWVAEAPAAVVGEAATDAPRAVVGYAGGLIVDGDLQILKIAVAPEWRRHGIARELLHRVAEDARNLGATTCSLEVRSSNDGARAFYETVGLAFVGTRPRYYSDREDAAIMAGPLPERRESRTVAGMELQHLDGAEHAPEHAPGPCRISKTPLILAFESSCDETAAAVVDGSGELRSDVVASQIDFHARFGGVVPEIASRKHIEAICGVAAEALDVAGITWHDVNSIAVTYAPGLLGALVVGVAFAKGAAWALDIPLIRVNHLEGHLYANKIGLAAHEPDFAPPAVVSLVSGGNTMLVHMRDWGDYRVLGETIDDAVGEAFDKVAKALGLGYPGGPAISRAARAGNPAAIAFPRAMLHSHDLRFSLSGLKTAVVNYINGERAAGRPLNIPDITASFQAAVVDVQVAKAATALEQTGAPTFCLGGGVAANPALREAYEKMCAKRGVRLIMPPLTSCGDNAGMIALVALERFGKGAFATFDTDASAHANLEEPY